FIVLQLIVTLHCLLQLTFVIDKTKSTKLYTLSLHDALPIFHRRVPPRRRDRSRARDAGEEGQADRAARAAPPERRAARDLGRQRSEEHTSELQSQSNLVCRLLLEKKNYKQEN